MQMPVPHRSIEELAEYLARQAATLRMIPTKAEAAVKSALISLGFEFQSPMMWHTKNGGYGGAIFDFYHPGALLVVEIDDPSHKQRKGRDRRRDNRFQVEGLRMVRIPNRRALKETAVVIEEIKQEMER